MIVGTISRFFKVALLPVRSAATLCEFDLPPVIRGVKADKGLLYIRTAAKIHSSGFIVQHIHITALWFQPFFNGKGRHCIWAQAGVAAPCTSGRRRPFLVGQSARGDRRARTSRSRPEARVERALPDGFLIPLLFSRSSAICDVKKPNLITRWGQVSEFAHSCHSRGSFSGYVQITATQISLECLRKKKEMRMDRLSLSPQRDVGCCSRTLQPQITTGISFLNAPYWVVSVSVWPC